MTLAKKYESHPEAGRAAKAEVGAGETPPPRADGHDPLLGCLEFLTRYYERPHSREALKTGLPETGGSISAALFVRAAERAGLAARVVKRRLSAIPASLLPVVLIFEDGEACVLVRHDGDGQALVQLPEAGGGVREFTGEQLKKRYAGYAILVSAKYQRGADDDVVREDPGQGWLWPALRRNLWIYGQVIVAAFLVNLFALASPLFIMTVYDRVIPNTAIETLWVLAIGVATVFVFDFVVRTLRGYFVDVAGNRADVTIGNRLFDHVLDMEMAARPPSAGVLAATLREFESLRDFFTSATLVAVVDLPFIFLFVFVIWAIGGPLAWIPLIAIPVVIVAGLVIQAPLAGVVRDALNESGRKQGVLFESLGALETVKSVRAEGRMRRKWETASAVAAKAGLRSRLLSMLAINLTITVQQLATVVLVVFGVLLIRDGALTVGALIAAVILGGRALAPLAQVAQLLTRLHQARNSFRALRTLMRSPVERRAGRNFLQRPRLEGAIEFRDLGFTYPEQPVPALANISFAIAPGEKVGIIGRIGSGKSTVARLLLGLYPPGAGTILVDGTDIRQIDPADLRRNVGCVPQDVVLFRGSVRENITIGDPLANDAAILTAAELAGVDEFVSQHPMGYDLPVGELGEGLSRGQRQTIALARTLLLDPPILVLDEPSSAMDNRTEARLRVNLELAAKAKTLILITHRASLLPMVERLIVLDSGGVLADGPREEVLKAIAEGKIVLRDQTGSTP